jgi:hypothetical protein
MTIFFQNTISISHSNSTENTHPDLTSHTQNTNPDITTSNTTSKITMLHFLKRTTTPTPAVSSKAIVAEKRELREPPTSIWKSMSMTSTIKKKKPAKKSSLLRKTTSLRC